MRLLLGIGLLAGLLLAVAGQAERLCTSALDGHLLFAEKGTIWETSAEGENRTALANYTGSSLSLDYDAVADVMYWCNFPAQQVHSLASGRQSVAIASTKNWLPVGVAADPLSGMLYVAEGFSDTVQLFDLRSVARGPHVIVGTNVSEIRKIVLDPYRGYLFVLDRYQILRTDLDGEKHQSIYSETGSVYDIVNELPGFFRHIFDYSLQRNSSPGQLYKRPINVPDVALDLEERRVYWINGARQRLESADYEGRERRTHYEEKSGFRLEEAAASIGLIDEYLYWASDATEKVVKVDVNNASNSKVIMKRVKAHAMRGVSCSAHRAVRSPCADANCQQLCLRSASNEKRFRCACDLGYQLNDDGLTCRPADEFLLYSQNEFIRGRLLTSSQSGLVDVLNPTKFEVGSLNVLDYDASDDVLFYTSLYPKNKLHQLQLDTGEETVLQPDLLSRDVSQFAYDWSTRNIYYFAHYYADATMLAVTNARNPTHSKLLLGHADGLIRSLAVHPRRGYLFYASLFEDDNQATITRIGMDGSRPKVIVTSDALDTLDGLALDYDEDRIYWSQAQRASNGAYRVTIRHSDLNGRGVQELSLPEKLARVDYLVVSGDYLYALLNGEKLVRLRKRGSAGEAVVLASAEISGSLSGLRLFSRSFQADDYRPCASLDCDKMCLVGPETKSEPAKAKCACPYGERLAEDGRSCLDNRDDEPAFIACEYESFKCNKKTAPAA